MDQFIRDVVMGLMILMYQDVLLLKGRKETFLLFKKLVQN